MPSAWLDVPLADYEAHMALASVGQARFLADQLEAAVRRFRPASLALIGCAGGNGLARLMPYALMRVLALDINPDYVARTQARYAGTLPLECRCADIAAGRPPGPAVDLVIAGLVFEYVDVHRALRSMRALTREGGALATVLQGAATGQGRVAPSPYPGVSRLAAELRALAPQELASAAREAGYRDADGRWYELPGGRRFWSGCLTA